MAETIVYGFLAFATIGGLCLVYGMVVAEYQSWKRRRRIQDELKHPRVEVTELRQQKACEPGSLPVRGYDSTELFRNDCVIRIRELEREICKDLKEIERDRSKLLRK